MNPWILWMAAMLALSSLAAAQTVGDPVASKSAAALEEYEKGEFEAARNGYRDALVERPESAALHLNVGDALYRLGDYPAAAAEFEQAGREDNAEVAAQGYYNLGNARFQQQDFPGAVDAYRQALEHAAEDVDAKANLELALQHLQPPPQSGGDGEQREEDEEQQKEGQPQPQPSDEEEDREQEDQQHGQKSPPGGEEAQGEHASERPSAQEGEGMGEEEAENLLEALEHRESEAQERRFRSKRMGDLEKDW
ncbi:MAG: tetratricopeptide repeat protein [Candidatus Latescibacterota bacterium]|nr:tetratricopeptide repeat protein [Candidatus Latescibacterota bacterium]